MVAARMLIALLLVLAPHAAGAQAPAGLQNKSAVVSGATRSLRSGNVFGG